MRAQEYLSHGKHDGAALCRLTANLTDDAGAALFVAEVGATREEGLHEVSFTPRISGALPGRQLLTARPGDCVLRQRAPASSQRNACESELFKM